MSWRGDGLRVSMVYRSDTIVGVKTYDNVWDEISKGSLGLTMMKSDGPLYLWRTTAAVLPGCALP